MNFVPFKIISGCETGADRAGLDAARDNAIPIGGNMPDCAAGEDGPIPAYYGLTRSGYDDPAKAIELNAMQADATIILHKGLISGGTLITLEMARKHAKPVAAFDVTKGHEETLSAIREFLETVRPTVLNIGGPRESKAPGLYKEARALLSEAFNFYK